MGASFQSQCYADTVSAVAAFCAASYPQTRIDAVTGVPNVLTCAPAPTGVAAVIYQGAAPSSPDEGCTTWHIVSPAAGVDSHADYGPASNYCAASASVSLAGGGQQISCTASGHTASEVVRFAGTDYTFAATRDCPAPPASTTVALSFGACNPTEQYEDMGSMWGLGLVALALVWACKTFIYRLVTNQ